MIHGLKCEAFVSNWSFIIRRVAKHLSKDSLASDVVTRTQSIKQEKRFKQSKNSGEHVRLFAVIRIPQLTAIADS